MGIIDSRGGVRQTLDWADEASPIGLELDQVIAGAMGSTMLASTRGLTALTTSTAMANSTLLLSAIYIPYAMTLTGVVWWQAVQGNYTANNNSKVGLYTSDGTNLSLVASCADDTALWKATTNSFAQKAFSATYNAAAGATLWVGALWNRSAQTTAPSLGAHTALTNLAVGKPLNGSVTLQGTIGTQTDLPASPLWTAVTATTTCPWFGVY